MDSLLISAGAERFMKCFCGFRKVVHESEGGGGGNVLKDPVLINNIPHSWILPIESFIFKWEESLKWENYDMPSQNIINKQLTKQNAE